ncbi:hypothetical protein GCM10011482_05650 [Enterococcus alcedinis]|uniref:VWFA domain-containing protein n=1 Tax=Enterococcus alcedinis TaxID=1274384 RepID=A0A917N3Z0_9ENTE|nr:SpaA isopeptide-forming pilin-related protein [Enterococcus alcedinis]MBP2100791.1 LPXTG-motif cell wall-anchored protein [Enterococcus alcedinis]GGI64911.1 hypothetical protein GCM10011482_05650 [Enterococcus alcedinis]
MRKKGMVWFSLLLLLISVLPNFFQVYIAYAQSPEEVKQTIIQSDYLNVSTTSRQVNEELLWEINYSMGVPAENHTRRIKIKVFNQDERDVIQPEQLAGWTTSADNWFQTEALSQTGKGTVTIRTASNVSELQLKVQIDEEVTNEVEVAGETPEATTMSQEKVLTENILVAPFADSHTLSAPIVQASTDTTVETSPVETTEVDSSIKETESSEESTSTTESSKTESSPSEGSEEGSSESEAPVPQKNNSRYIQSAPGFIGPLSVEALADTGTPFDYTTDGTGTFPTHGTNKYLPGTGTNVNIKNFDFGTDVPGGTIPSIEHILGQNNFNDGYHSYQFGEGLTDVLMKKTVKPTADPTKFDIELDVIGGTNRTTNKIDVVFVIDKSGSMTANNSPRWANLKTELAKFSKDLMEASFEPGNIKMGLVAFGDNQSGTGNDAVYTPYAKMADFGTAGSQTSTIVGFTEDYTKFDGNNSATRHPLLASNPNGGTALFLGIDGGIELLKNASYGARPDARKVLIVLSDGVATYAPRTSNYAVQADFQNKLVKTRQDTNSTLQFSATRSGGNGVQFVGNGQESDNNLLGGNNNGNPRTNVIGLTNDFIANRRPNSSTIIPIFPISIGFGLTGDYATQAKGILRNFAGSSTTDPNSNFYDAAVDNLGDALDQIKTLILTLNDVVRNGNIIDPMSDYVSLIGGTLKSYALSLNTATKNLNAVLTTANNAPQYAKNAVVDQTTNPITVSNLYLGGREDIRDGYRLTYTVQLKEQYQDGLFYPANKRTTVTAANITDPLDFSVPSVRHSKTISIPVEKIWIDDNNDWNTRQDITLQLQKQNGNNWENVTNGSFAIAKTATGNALKHTFSNLPSYVNGQVINYRIVETPARVLGYDPGVPTPVSTNIQANDKTLKMTNNLKKISLGKFTKVNQNGDKLVGVKFQLFKADGTTSLSTERTSNTNGEVDFSNINLPVGTYKLRETHTLPGYETIADKTITVTDTGTTSVNLVLTGLDERPNEPGNQVVNHLRLFTLKVTKEDNRGDPLEGATFTLKRTLPTPETPITGTTNQNIFTYAGLSAGTYILTETGTPNGYIGVEPMTIVISANGQVTIDGTAYTPTTTEGETLIQLTVKNRQKGQLPSTGGQGTQQFLIATLVLVALAGAIGIYYVYRNRKGAE